VCAFVVFLSSSGQSRENYYKPLRHDCSGLKSKAVHSAQAVYCSSAKQDARVPLNEKDDGVPPMRKYGDLKQH
jgi:hypothetical protein